MGNREMTQMSSGGERLNVDMLLEELSRFGVNVRVDGSDLVATPASKIPGRLFPLLKKYKNALLARVSDDGRKQPAGSAGDNELLEIERRVREDGFVLLWSTVLHDSVAFYLTEADRVKIPPGFVQYSDSELRILFDETRINWTPEGLHRIHKAKNVGSNIVGLRDDVSEAYEGDREV